MLAPALLLASAAILLALGSIHLAYTYFGNRLVPRDGALRIRMGEVSPVLTTQTDMWRCWVGFNASHSLGAMLFGLVYGFLAVARPDVLFSSPYLMFVGLLMLSSFLVLGKLYWFSIPYWCTGVALACYVAGIALTLA